MKSLLELHYQQVCRRRLRRLALCCVVALCVAGLAVTGPSDARIAGADRTEVAR